MIYFIIPATLGTLLILISLLGLLCIPLFTEAKEDKLGRMGYDMPNVLFFCMISGMIILVVTGIVLLGYVVGVILGG